MSEEEDGPDPGYQWYITPHAESVTAETLPTTPITPTPYSPVLPGLDALANIRAEAAAANAAKAAKAAEASAAAATAAWRCYKPGDLNPHLNTFSSMDVMGDAQLASYSSNPLASIGEALGRSIRPDVTRGTKSSAIRAVVLGGYTTGGQEALSYNMNVDPAAAGALANRAQVLYIRVPELTFLSDPYCNDNSFTAEQIDAMVKMHPRATIPNWASTQPDIIPGTLVEVEFTEGWSRAIVKRILDEATNLLIANQMLSAMGAFGAGGGGAILGITPTPDPHKIWDKLYQTLASGNHWIKSEHCSPKIKSIPSKLQMYMSSKGRSDVKVVSNGNRRTVEATFKGGSGRIPTSLHMLGLAHDLQITSKDVSKYGYAGKAPHGSNGILIKDHQLVRLMKAFATENRLIFGGEWKQGVAEKIPAGDGVAAFTAYTMELHHFQLFEADYAANLPASLLKALTDTGFSVADLKSSSKRSKVYQRIASDVVV